MSKGNSTVSESNYLQNDCKSSDPVFPAFNSSQMISAFIPVSALVVFFHVCAFSRPSWPERFTQLETWVGRCVGFLQRRQPSIREKWGSFCQ